MYSNAPGLKSFFIPAQFILSVLAHKTYEYITNSLEIFFSFSYSALLSSFLQQSQNSYIIYTVPFSS